MQVIKIAWSHRTKILGYAQVVIGALAVADQQLVQAAIGADGLRWVLLANGILTALVGHYNGRQVRVQPVAVKVTE